MTAAHTVAGSGGQIALSPDGKRFAVPVGPSRVITEYDVDTMSQVAAYPQESSSYNALAYAPASGRVAAGETFGATTVDIFSTTSHALQVATICRPYGNPLNVMAGTHPRPRRSMATPSRAG